MDSLFLPQRLPISLKIGMPVTRSGNLPFCCLPNTLHQPKHLPIIILMDCTLLCSMKHSLTSVKIRESVFRQCWGQLLFSMNHLMLKAWKFCLSWKRAPCAQHFSTCIQLLSSLMLEMALFDSSIHHSQSSLLTLCVAMIPTSWSTQYFGIPLLQNAVCGCYKHCHQTFARSMTHRFIIKRLQTCQSKLRLVFRPMYGTHVDTGLCTCQMATSTV